jgi:hypothetical protein
LFIGNEAIELGVLRRFGGRSQHLDRRVREADDLPVAGKPVHQTQVRVHVPQADQLPERLQAGIIRSNAPKSLEHLARQHMVEDVEQTRLLYFVIEAMKPNAIRRRFAEAARLM